MIILSTKYKSITANHAEKSSIIPPKGDLSNSDLIGESIGSVNVYNNCTIVLFLPIGIHDNITRANIKNSNSLKNVLTVCINSICICSAFLSQLFITCPRKYNTTSTLDFLFKFTRNFYIFRSNYKNIICYSLYTAL